MKKRFMSVALTLCMVLGMMPLKAFAVESGTFTEPKVTQLTVSYDGGEPVDLLGNQPTVSMPAGSKPVFTVTFDSIELLNKVFVTSTKDGETKYLETTLQDGKYVTDSYFDPNDTNYIPGTIAVTYSKKTIKVNESGNVGGIDLNTLKSQLNNQGISLESTSEDDKGTVTAKIVLKNVLTEAGNVYVDAAVSEFSGDDADALRKWLGACGDLAESAAYRITGEDGKEYDLYLKLIEKIDESGLGEDAVENFVVILKDITGSKYTKTVIQLTDKSKNIDVVADELSVANTAVSAIYDYYAITKKSNELRAEIDNSSLSDTEKAQAHSKINALENDKKWFLMGMTFIPVLVGSAALTGGASAGLLFSAYLAGFSASSDYFWEHRIGLIKGCDPIKNTFFESDSHGTALTRESLKETNSRLPGSGNYYVADDGIIIIVPELASTSKNVAICLHGHRDVLIVNAGNASLTISDCMYTGESNEFVADDSAFIENSSNGSLYIKNCNAWVENDGAASIASGWIAGIDNSGTIDILGGTFINRNTSGGAFNFFKNTGIMNISGGNFINQNDRDCCVINFNGGTLNISGGSMTDQCTDDSHCVENYGTLTIAGGSFERSGETSRGACIINHSDGYATIHGGSVNAHNLSSGIQNSGKLTFISGTVTSNQTAISNYKAQLTIRGGTVESIGLETNRGCTGVINSGEMIMSGGYIKASGAGIYTGMYYGIDNDGGTLQVNGGTIDASWAIAYDTVTISNGKILGSISNPYDGDIVTLLISENTNIEVDSIANTFQKTPVVKADAGYTGGVTYYSSVNSQGVPMTVEQAAAIDYTTSSYVRLVADGSASSGDCEHTYTAVVTAPTCTERGYTTHTCSLCGMSYKDSYTDALGHSYGEWVVTVDATATANGQRERICSRCNNKETEIIPATGGSPSGENGGDTWYPNAPSNITTTTTKNSDGSTTTTMTNKTTGVVTQTTRWPDGRQEKTVTQADGSKQFDNKSADGTTASGAVAANGRVDGTVKVAGKAVTDANGGPVELPLPNVPVAAGSAAASTIKVDLPNNAGADVAIPVSGSNPGVVALLVNSDGTETVLKKSVLVNGKLYVPLTGDATVKIVDNSENFSDMGGHWSADAVTFVTSRELFEGDGNGNFMPNNTMTRAMLVTVLHRLENTPAGTGMSFDDVANGQWYTTAVSWAAENKIVEGYNGFFTPNNSVTREQIAAILYRYAKAIGVATPERGSFASFLDGDSTSGWAQEAMSWAVGAGLFSGGDGERLNPGGNATRAEVATILMRFVEYMVK